MKYNVHEKLQNFMAPEDRGSWSTRCMAGLVPEQSQATFLPINIFIFVTGILIAFAEQTTSRFAETLIPVLLRAAR
jgi:hypothetical protein